MKSKFILGLIGICMLTSCADDYTFEKDGVKVTATPYGWMNQDDKIPGVVYELNIGNLVWDAILCETIVVPVILTGTQLYEPVGLKEEELK